MDYFHFGTLWSVEKEILAVGPPPVRGERRFKLQCKCKCEPKSICCAVYGSRFSLNVNSKISLWWSNPWGFKFITCLYCREVFLLGMWDNQSTEARMHMLTTLEYVILSGSSVKCLPASNKTILVRSIDIRKLITSIFLDSRMLRTCLPFPILFRCVIIIKIKCYNNFLNFFLYCLQPQVIIRFFIKSDCLGKKNVVIVLLILNTFFRTNLFAFSIMQLQILSASPSHHSNAGFSCMWFSIAYSESSDGLESFSLLNHMRCNPGTWIHLKIAICSHDSWHICHQATANIWKFMIWTVEMVDLIMKVCPNSSIPCLKHLRRYVYMVSAYIDLQNTWHPRLSTGDCLLFP